MEPKESPPPMVWMSMRLPESLRDRLGKMAKREKRTVSDLIRKLLDKVVK